VKKERAEEFGKYVLQELRLHDWHMEWETIDPIGFCYPDLKFFTVPPSVLAKSEWETKEYILHEVAHIFVDNTGHGRDFYEQYITLLWKFIVEREENKK